MKQIEIGHFLSTKAWASFRQALGETTLHREDDDWSYLALIQKVGFMKKLYCPYSPVIYQSADLDRLFRDLEQQAKKVGAIFSQIEPIGEVTTADLERHGYQKVKSIQPELTWVLNLCQDPEQILADMASSNRNIYRNYHKKGLEFSETTNLADVDAILQLLHEVAKHNKVRLHQNDYLRKQAEVLLANQAMKCFVVRLEGKIIAGALVYDDDHTRYYAHAAADYEHRRLKPGVVLLAEMIFDARRSGLKWFDFYGITDSLDPNHPWAGFTAFKKGFGGQEKHYLGTWQKVNRPLLYRLYKILQKIKQLFRR